MIGYDIDAMALRSEVHAIRYNRPPMSYSSVPPFEGELKPRTLPRELDAIEIRVLGCLMEKQLATPEYYPLTLNALLAAGNQKSNREPVMHLSEREVEMAVNRLQDEKLVWRVVGGRATRFDHNLDRALHLDTQAKALLTLLFLRGAQTAGELRGRSDRLHAFATVPEVETVLQQMAAEVPALVRELPRRPGQKEQRWAHLLGGVPVEPVAFVEESESSIAEPLSIRVARLEERVASLASELLELKAKLGE
ncbi:MAG TPA: YceH family protein [Thermoanaerobaculia bacterium]|nr:YceH family protein [Thermoanaerobaculia bacterium]